VFDRTVVDPVWDLYWPELFSLVPRRRLQFTELVAFCLALDGEKDAEKLDDVLANWRIRETIRRASPQSLMISDILSAVAPKLGGSVQFATRYLSDAQCLLASAIVGMQRGVFSIRDVIPIAILDDGDHPAFNLSSKERLALRPVWDATSAGDSRTIYRWQGQPEPMGDLPEVWLGVRAARRLFKVIWQAWDGDWNLPLIRSQQDARHVSIVLDDRRPVTFREFDTAKLFAKSRRKIEKFTRPAMFMDIT
jgi:hypothetical protein